MATELTKLTYTIEGEEPVELDLKKINCIDITGLTNGRQYKITLTATNAEGSVSDEVFVTPTAVSTPTSGLMVYIDGNDVNVSGTDITRINDPVHGDHFLPGQGTAQLVSGALGTNDAIRFTGSETFFNTGQTLPNFSDEATIYLVSSADQAQTSSIIHTSDFDRSNALNIHIPYNLSSDNNVAVFDFGDRDNNGRLLDNWKAQFGTVYIWEFKVRNGRMEIWQNETLIASQSVSSEVSFTDEILELGGRLSISEDRFDGDLYFMAIYNEYHETNGTKRADVLDYLNTRFDVIAESAPLITSIEAKDESADVYWQHTPGAPTFTVSEAETKVTVTVTDIHDGNLTITDYKYQLDGGDWVSVGSSTGEFEITGLTTSTTYSLKVLGVNSRGDGTASAATNVTPSAGADASGGDSVYTITVGAQDYKVHEFQSSGTFTINTGGEFEHLIVAGGGGGGYSAGGGGGGGEVIETTETITSGSYSVTVGAGGAGASADDTPGSDGSDSSFNSITADGGGGGGSINSVQSTAIGDTNERLAQGSDGGNGGGSAGVFSDTATQGDNTSTNYGSATGSGNRGGEGARGNSPSRQNGGGGGGFGTAGEDVDPTTTFKDGGNGGGGFLSEITGSPEIYGAGGGGGATSDSSGIGGTGGTNAGNGGSGDGTSPTAGTANYGGGGGGGNANAQSGASGGSGTVIIRYKV